MTGAQQKLETLARMILERPGCTAGQLRRETGLSWSEIKWALTALEARGVLLTEDGQGRLYLFEPYDLERILGEDSTKR